MLNIKNFLSKILFILISIIVGLVICETALRVIHKFSYNYDIEMWKYAKKLKIKDENPKIGHTHIKNKSENLQGVEISINNYGQRDINLNNSIIQDYDRSFLILGSSVALGWGVEQKDTFTNILNKISEEDKKNWIFINGGIGNYNTERYVNNYLENWKELEFSDIIIHFFVNDTEVIKESKTNFFTTHTHLGVIIWKLVNTYKSSFSKDNLDDYYKKRYKEDYEGFKTTLLELERLKNHCKNENIKCHIILMPDIHQLNPYNLKFINEKISIVSKKLNFLFLDLLNVFENVDEKKIWNKYQDPHPNGYAHNLMAKEIYNYLTK